MSDLRSETATLPAAGAGPNLADQPAVAKVAWGGPSDLGLRKKFRVGEALIQGFLFLCGAVSVLTTIGIIYVLGRESWLFFGSDEVTLASSFSPYVGNR